MSILLSLSRFALRQVIGGACKAVAWAYAARGAAYWGKGDFDRAIADCDEAIRLAPKYAWAYHTRGNAYRMKGDFDRAIADASEAIRLDPKGRSDRHEWRLS